MENQNQTSLIWLMCLTSWVQVTVGLMKSNKQTNYTNIYSKATFYVISWYWLYLVHLILNAKKLKVLSATFLLVYFARLKESTC